MPGGGSGCELSRYVCRNGVTGKKIKLRCIEAS